LDEPSLGLAPLLINTIFEIILEIQKMGTTILLVEQNAFKALSIADKAYVFNQGCVSMSGDAAAILADPSIREAYLGKTK
jgi:branched-chain amino acid transport system ATP-binding protein